MGKKDKSKKGKGAEKTAAKTMKKQQSKLKKELAARGEEDLEKVVKELEDAEKKKNKIVEELVKEGPSRRANFSLSVHPEKDELIMFGGEYYSGQKTMVYGDLFTYNIRKKDWLRIQAPGAAPPRCAHQAVVTGMNGGQLYIFGGEYASPSQSQFYHYKDLWVFHLKTKSWEKIAATLGPSARSGHRMVLNKKHLVVFGGYYDNGIDYKYYSDVHLFDLENRTWRKVEPSGNGPTPRSGCQMVTLPDGRVLIYGGYSKIKVKKDVDQGTVHSDAFLLVPDKNDTTGAKWKWQTVKISGIRPSPRTGMSVTSNPAGTRAYFFGGVFDNEEDEESLFGNFFNDFYCLDLEKLHFNQITLKGKRPEKKKNRDDETESENIDEAEMESLNLQESEMEVAKPEIVHDDGVFTVTIGPSQSATSAQGSAEGAAAALPEVLQPPPRMGCGLAIKHGVLYLYGGIVEDGDKQFTLRDMFSIDLHKLEEWEELVHDEDARREWIDSDSGSGESGSEEEDEDDDEEDDSNEEDMDTD